MSNKRPVNLQLTTIKFPVTAIVSILHRISGLVIFLLLPLLLWMLSSSLSSAESFDALQTCLSAPWVKLIVWGLLAAIVYHVFAGIRHLLMDFGVAEEKQSGKVGAYITIILAVVAIVIVGMMIW